MDEKRFTLRMDGTLFNEISDLAASHRRSVAKEIECAIAEYLRREQESHIIDKYGLDPSHEDAVKELRELKALRDKFNEFK